MIAVSLIPVPAYVNPGGLMCDEDFKERSIATFSPSHAASTIDVDSLLYGGPTRFAEYVVVSVRFAFPLPRNIFMLIWLHRWLSG